MTPFQEFRLWARRAPGAERLAAVIATVLVLALLAWIVQPSGRRNDNASSDSAIASTTGLPAQPRSANQSAPGGAPGTSVTAAVAPGPGNATGASTSVAATRGAASGQSAASAVGRTCPQAPGGTPGITATQIKVAVTLIQIVGAAANSSFAIPTPDTQKAEMQAVIDSVNAAGGVACRKIVPQYFIVNAADQNDRQQKCLDVVSSKPFAEFDIGAYSLYPEKECFARSHIPYFGNYYIVASEAEKYYPYLFDMQTDDALYRDTVFGLRDRGFFKPASGFKKLGVLYRSCWPQLVTSVMTWLKQAGLSSSQVVGYDLGCPTYLASPSDLEQAVLKFQQAGVTNVTDVYALTDLASFTSVAQQQGFHPKYGLPDDALISISAGAQHPDYNNINGAIAITTSRDGENTTPGMKPTAGTAKCDAIYRARGLATTYQEPEVAGSACDQVWMFQAAVEHAPVLQQAALAAGLQRTRTLDLSFPQGPADFSGQGVTTGGQFWRVAQFTTACNCWRVVDRAFHPNYA